MRLRTFILPALLAGASLPFSGPSAARSPVHLRDDGAPMARGRLGIVPLAMSPELRATLGAPSDRGVLVDRVTPDSPAAKAGVKVGDVIAEVAGQPVEDRADVVRAMAGTKAGEAVVLRIVRDRQSLVVAAKLDGDADGGWLSIQPDDAVPPGGGAPDLGPWELRWPDMLTRRSDPERQRLEQRIEALEKRLGELESKLTR